VEGIFISSLLPWPCLEARLFDDPCGVYTPEKLVGHIVCLPAEKIEGDEHSKNASEPEIATPPQEAGNEHLPLRWSPPK
jgi:hypothetical protein